MKVLNKTILILPLIFMTFSCEIFKVEKENVKNNSQTMNTDWRFGWSIKPDNTLDKVTLKSHFTKYPERWKAAFEFLKDSDLASLAVGEYEILGRDVYASVSEYTPKEPADCNFEAHKKYIDLQYMIYGEEIIGISKLKNVVSITEYDQNKDITFFRQNIQANYKIATPDVFFVFFPDDAHCPSMKNKDNIKVKKIVIKIKV